MKKSFPANTQLITIALFYFLALPIVATAAITYTRSPSGVSATSPVTVTLSADSFAEFGMPPETLSYNIQIEEFEGALNFQGSCYL
ncbi:MAG: hypothetical protein Q7S52_04170, partial [bacterium]|nr:hypothetical protein [bacterium]